MSSGADFLALAQEAFNCYFLNEKRLPLVVEARTGQDAALLHAWTKKHAAAVKGALREYGAIYFAGFQVEPSAVAGIIGDALGKPRDYRGGDGARRKVAEGLYTSTEAPPRFYIPLHNEESVMAECRMEYICFICDVPPPAGSGETLLGRTRDVTRAIRQVPGLWETFAGRRLKLVTRNPPKRSLFARLNPTHKAWENMFETEDRSEVAARAKLKKIDLEWDGEWLVTTRIAPATIMAPYSNGSEEYFFNQAHLYDLNPVMRGGRLNHILGNLLYCRKRTLYHSISFDDDSPIPRERIYQVYDVLAKESVKPAWRQKGDMLWVNNFEAMHGRAPSFGQRNILVSMVDRS